MAFFFYLCVVYVVDAVFSSGVEIAIVREDSTSALCEDSCSFAEDGQCDEPGVVSGVAC